MDYKTGFQFREKRKQLYSTTLKEECVTKIDKWENYRNFLGHHKTE